MVSLFCPTSPPIDRISILGDFAAGYVRHAENEHATVRTFKQMLDHGVIDQADMDLMHFVETADEAWAVIRNWYQLA